MADDGIRERHGMPNKIDVREEDVSVFIETESGSGNRFSPTQARYIARKLYRIARRIEQRAEAAQ